MKLNRKSTKQILMLGLLLIMPLMFGKPTAAQETPVDPQRSANGAKITSPTQNADDDPLAQMLQQSIAEARAFKALAEARLQEIEGKDRLLVLDEKEIAKLKQIIETSDKLIARLEKQCSTTSFLFGLIKIKRC